MASDDVFDLHEPYNISSFILIKLHGDEFNGLLKIRYQSMLKSIDTPSGLFYLGSNL
jgi:hypothetical protein